MSYISPPNTLKEENSSKRKLKRKGFDIWVRETMILIDIGYKSAAQQTDMWRKDTKDEEATLI